MAEQKHPAGKPLHEVLEGVELRAGAPAGNLLIEQVTCDSRKVRDGALFVAVHGTATDGNLYAKDAVARGARAVLSAERGARGLVANRGMDSSERAAKSAGDCGGELLWQAGRTR